MKKIYLSLIAIIFAINYSYAQWTSSGSNIYYPGNVAIGSSGLWAYYNFSVATNTYPDGILNANGGTVSVGDYYGDKNQTFLYVDDNAATITTSASNFNLAANNFNLTTTQFQITDWSGRPSLSVGTAGGAGLNSGTGYLGFNATRSGTNWTLTGDGFHNGGGVIYNGILNGEIYFAPIENTGTTGKTLTDLDIKSRIAFRITPTAAYAKKVIVELTGWPDYVFKPTYNLKPLSEVKSYIDQNHHLPEMPSEKEVAEKGLDVGEMNKLLTKKVEELTLYMIEKDDDNKSLKSELLKQAEVIKQMQQKLEALTTAVSATHQ